MLRHCFDLSFSESGPFPTETKTASTGADGADSAEGRPLLRLRTDFNVTTLHVQALLDELPVWTTEFGKSTSPFRLAYLAAFDYE